MGRTWSPDFVEKLWSPQFGKGLMHLVFSPRVWLSVCSLWSHWEWGDRLSTSQVLRLLLHEPWLHRRKRDCTPALFLTCSVSTSATSLCTSEEEGLHTALPPRNVGMYFGGGGTSPPPHNDGVYFGGRETGSRPHTDECFMCHNEQDPLLFLADMFLL